MPPFVARRMAPPSSHGMPPARRPVPHNALTLDGPGDDDDFSAKGPTSELQYDNTEDHDPVPSGDDTPEDQPTQVSPDMVTAGVKALQDASKSGAAPDEIVTSIYQAMEQAEPDDTDDQSDSASGPPIATQQ